MGSLLSRMDEGRTLLCDPLMRGYTWLYFGMRASDVEVIELHGIHIVWESGPALGLPSKKE